MHMLTNNECRFPYFQCSDELKRHYNTGQYWISIDVEDVASFDQILAEKLHKQPTEHLPLVISNYQQLLSIYKQKFCQ